MSFLSGNELIYELKTSKVNLLKKVKKLKIPFLKKGKRKYYLSKYEYIEDVKSRLTNCNIISFGNHRAGVAKTTTVINIGSTLAFYGFKVLLIDMDVQSNLSKHFGINNLKHTINSAINGNINIANLNHDFYNFGKMDILTNDLSLTKKFYCFDIKKFDKLIMEVKKEYDFILLDTPPNIIDITPQSLSISNYAFISSKPDAHSTTGVINFIDLIEKSNSKLLGGVITNNYKTYISDITNIETVDKIFKNYSKNLCDTRISYSNIFNEVSLFKEHSVLTYKPTHKCTMEYFDLTNYLLNNILRG